MFRPMAEGARWSKAAPVHRSTVRTRAEKAGGDADTFACRADGHSRAERGQRTRHSVTFGRHPLR